VSIRIGTKVRVERDATYHVRVACKKAKKTYLLGVTKNTMDPCCGCYVVEFSRNIGTDSTFGGKGKLGYCEEVEEGFMTVVGKAATPKVTKTFKVGDRVVWTSDDYGPAKNGAIAIVRVVEKEGRDVGVEFIENYNLGRGHELNGEVKNNSGWWVGTRDLRLIEPGDEFKVGTKVIIVETHDSARVGMKGVIAVVDKDKTSHPYGVQFAGWTGGHSLESRLKGKQVTQGQWVPLASMQVLAPGATAPVAKAYARSTPKKREPISVEGGYSVRILHDMKTAIGGNLLLKGSTWSAEKLTPVYGAVYFIIPFGGSNTILAHESQVEVL